MVLSACLYVCPQEELWHTCILQDITVQWNKCAGLVINMFYDISELYLWVDGDWTLQQDSASWLVCCLHGVAIGGFAAEAKRTFFWKFNCLFTASIQYNISNARTSRPQLVSMPAVPKVVFFDVYRGSFSTIADATLPASGILTCCGRGLWASSCRHPYMLWPHAMGINQVVP